MTTTFIFFLCTNIETSLSIKFKVFWFQTKSLVKMLLQLSILSFQFIFFKFHFLKMFINIWIEIFLEISFHYFDWREKICYLLKIWLYWFEIWTSNSIWYFLDLPCLRFVFLVNQRDSLMTQFLSGIQFVQCQKWP
jgi:hypothetical protein